MSLGESSVTGKRTVVLVAIWTLLFAGAAGSVMSLGGPTGDSLVPSVVSAGDSPSSGIVAATDRPSLSVDVSRENSTLVYRAVVEAGDASHLRLDGAFGIYAVTGTDGLVADGAGYRLEAGRDRGTLTATIDLAETRETALGTVGPGGPFRVGDGWAFAPSPRFHVRWTAGGDAVRHLRFGEESTDSAVTVAADADVALGERFVFLGPHAVHTRTVDGQVLRVVVPARTEFGVGVDRSEQLLGAVQNQTGTRADGAITAFVLPEQVRSGGASSGRDVWVRADAGEVTVAHEFVHASLTLRTTAETRWLREASAEYLAYRVAGQAESVESLGETGRGTDATLADPTTWDSWRVPYEHGAATLAELDDRLRNASDGRVTVGGLFGRLSAASRSVDAPSLTHELFVQAVRDAGGDGPARWVDAAASA